MTLDFPGAFTTTTSVLVRGRWEGQSQKRRCDNDTEAGVTQDHEPRSGGPLEGGWKGKRMDSPLELLEGMQPC